MDIYGSDLHIESPWSNKDAQHRFLDLIEQENFRLKKLVADLSLDNAILKEASRGNY